MCCHLDQGGREGSPSDSLPVMKGRLIRQHAARMWRPEKLITLFTFSLLRILPRCGLVQCNMLLMLEVFNEFCCSRDYVQSQTGSSTPASHCNYSMIEIMLYVC